MSARERAIRRASGPTNAQRQQPTCCENCAKPSDSRHRLHVIEVEPVRRTAPDVGRLALCAGCLRGEHRTWRLRWRPTVPV